MALNIASSLESAVQAAQSTLSYYYTTSQNYAINYLGGSIVRPSIDGFPVAPNSTDSLALLEDQLYDPDKLLRGGWPVYNAPEPPDWEALSAELTLHTKRIWISSEMDAIAAKCMVYLEGGDAAWFTDNYQRRVFDKDRDRRLQAMSDALDEVAKRHAGRGNRLPNSALLARENEVIQKYQFDSTTRSGELMKMVEEAARDFMKFGLEKGLTYEQLNMEFTTAYNAALLEPIKLRYDIYSKQLEAEARSFEAEIRGVIARFEAEKASWELTGTYNEILMNKDLYPWKKYAIQMEGVVQKFQQQRLMFADQITQQTSALNQMVEAAREIIKIGGTVDINLLTGKIVA